MTIFDNLTFLAEMIRRKDFLNRILIEITVRIILVEVRPLEGCLTIGQCCFFEDFAILLKNKGHIWLGDRFATNPILSYLDFNFLDIFIGHGKALDT